MPTSIAKLIEIEALSETLAVLRFVLDRDDEPFTVLSDIETARRAFGRWYQVRGCVSTDTRTLFDGLTAPWLAKIEEAA